MKARRANFGAFMMTHSNVRHEKRSHRKSGCQCAARGDGRVAELLLLEQLCACSRKGKFAVHTRTIRKRLRRGLQAIDAWCQEHRHDPVGVQQQTLKAKLRGHYQYYGRPTNYHGIRQFYRAVRRIWRKWLCRRTRGRPLTWERYNAILRQYPLLRPQIKHPWASAGSTAGSVRGESPMSHGRLTRARNWKRWIRPKQAYSSSGLLSSDVGIIRSPLRATVLPDCGRAVSE